MAEKKKSSGVIPQHSEQGGDLVLCSAHYADGTSLDIGKQIEALHTSHADLVKALEATHAIAKAVVNKGPLVSPAAFLTREQIKAVVDEAKAALTAAKEVTK